MMTADEVRMIYRWMPSGQFEDLLNRMRANGTLREETQEEKEYIEKINRKLDPNRPKQRKYWCQFPHDELTRPYSEARRVHAFLLRCEGLKLKEIGGRLGISRERARSLINNEGRRIGYRLRKVRWTVTDAPSDH